MASVVRAIALREVPVSEGSTSYYIHPASVAHIRKFLFSLLGGTSQEVALAKNCLIAIDTLRDEYGIAASDPRHPDVMSEVPWPPEAGTFSSLGAVRGTWGEFKQTSQKFHRVNNS